MAQDALDAAPGEPTVVRRLKSYLTEFSGT
jgi:hypothetical protein